MREKWESMKHLVLFYYIFVAFVFILFTFVLPLDDSMDGLIRTILVVFLLGYPVVMFYTIRYALHVFLFTLAFITGFYGFYHHSIDNHSVLNALYFTFRLYLLDLADVFTQDGSSPIHYPLLLEIARWTAASYTITTIFIAMYRTLGREISLFLAQTIGKHHVVFSYNEKSHYFIRDLRDHGQRVIVVDERFSPETQNMLEAMEVIVIQAAINDADIFRLTGVRKAKSISLFHEKDQDSLYVLMNLEKYVQEKSFILQIKKLIIHLEDNRYQAELVSFLENVEHFSFPVDVINVYESIAQQFWLKHGDMFIRDEEVHLLVVGYDAFGKQLVMEAERNFALANKHHPFTITVFDCFMKKATAGRITFVPFDSEEANLMDVIEAEETTFTHVFICLHEDYIDLMEGLELSEHFGATPIYMKFKDESIEQTFMITTTKTKKSLYSTGIIQDVLTMEYLGL